MLYFRYRSGDELSIKELYYNEIYFSSAEESNDPYEWRMFVQFGQDKKLWKELLNNICNLKDLAEDKDLVEKVFDFFISRAPWTLDRLLKITREDLATLAEKTEQKTLTAKGAKQKELILPNILYSLKDSLIANTKILEKYFVSFSKTYKDPLMWAHYANNHKGFCLIFKTRNKAVTQDPNLLKTELADENLETKFNIPRSFQLFDVQYNSIPQFLNGFQCFESLRKISKADENEIESFDDKINNLYLQKPEDLKSEQEIRAILPVKHNTKSSWTGLQRLFHYDFENLQGIIFGQKMPQEKREQIKEIILEKRKHPSYRRDLCYILEENISDNNFNSETKPVEIFLPYPNTIKKPKDEHFDECWNFFQRNLENSQLSNDNNGEKK